MQIDIVSFFLSYNFSSSWRLWLDWLYCEGEGGTGSAFN